MLQVQCLRRYKVKGVISGYRIKELNTGEERDIIAEKLKENIKNELISVTNLKLTSDNRLIEVEPEDNNLKGIKIKEIDSRKTKINLEEFNKDLSRK